MAYTQSGLFLLSPYVHHNQLSTSCFQNIKRGQEKMLNVHLGFCNLVFCILRRPARLYEQGDLEDIMLACIILHNTIIEDEKHIEDVSLDLNEEATTSTV